MARKTSTHNLFRISSAAEAAGVTRRTVEYYILLGLIEPIRPPERSGRYFDEHLVQRIRLIRQLNESGYTLRDIRQTWLAGAGRRGAPRPRKKS